MCHMMAITTSNKYLSSIQRKQLFIHAMTLSEIELQKDGWGVTDGIYIYKSALSAGKMFYDLLDLNWDTMIMSHVRSASPQTEVSKVASHPYAFTLDSEKYFVGQHNGFISGSEVGYTADRSDPSTDSFKAFKNLASRMKSENHGSISASLIGDWLSQYEDTTKFAFMFMMDGKLTVIRGAGEKTLFWAKLGDSYIIHTSKNILSRLLEYCSGVLGLLQTEDVAIEEFSKDTVASVTIGSKWSEIENLKYKFIPKVYQTYQSNRQMTLLDRQEAATGEWVRTIIGTPQEELDEDRVAIWIKIKAHLYPMRTALCEAYLDHIVDSINPNEEFFGWENYKTEDLLAALEKIQDNPLAVDLISAISLWNIKVPDETELSEHYYQFGELGIWGVENPLRSVIELSTTEASRKRKV